MESHYNSMGEARALHVGHAKGFSHLSLMMGRMEQTGAVCVCVCVCVVVCGGVP